MSAPLPTVNTATNSLLTLPAELRTEMYILAFVENVGELDLMSATPPSKDLLLACRQIYTEAKGVYRAACRQFWSETRFTLLATPQAEAKIGSMKARDLSLVTSLCITNRREDRRVEYDAGLWTDGERASKDDEWTQVQSALFTPLDKRWMLEERKFKFGIGADMIFVELKGESPERIAEARGIARGTDGLCKVEVVELLTTLMRM